MKRVLILVCIAAVGLLACESTDEPDSQQAEETSGVSTPDRPGPSDLECGPDAMIQQVTSDHFGNSTGVKGEPTEVVRENAEGLRSSDVVVDLGAVEGDDAHTVGIEREGSLVAIVGLSSDGGGGWLFGGLTSCDPSGIQLRS